jgi:hypothetical protein
VAVQSRPPLILRRARRTGPWARRIRLAIGALAILIVPRLAQAQSGRELNVIPIAGGDSDVGIGVGAVGDLAALTPGRPPFKWRLELQAFITGKVQDGAFVLPFRDDSLELLIPRWGPGHRLHLDARISYTDEATLKYSGIGNASPPVATNLPDEHSEYGRIHPTASVELRARIFDNFYLLGGSAYTYNHLKVDPGTTLSNDQTMGSPEVRGLLGNFNPHGVELLTAEAQIDTRDDEIVTQRGQFHTLRFRYSPRVGTTLPYGYERFTLTTRFYRSTVGNWLTFRARLVGDLLLGSPPFYELARFDETPAIGGGNAVRGVPAQRYYGKVKVFENVELSGALWSFGVKGKRFMVGPAVFFDAGRTWTEISHAEPQLDGTGLGIKYGVGGGLRVQEGRTFVLRLDLAWSPDATPIGAYFAAGSIF